MKFIKNLSTKEIFSYLLIYSIFCLGFVLFLEHILNYKPCQLCLYQRIPYLLILVFTFIGFFFPKNIYWLYTIMILFISSTIISGYHSGIEFGLLDESSSCSSNSIESLDKTKILESLSNSMPSCKEMKFKLFGLSLATINFLISFALSFLIYFKINYEKNR